MERSCASVVSGILPDVEGGILPPGKTVRLKKCFLRVNPVVSIGSIPRTEVRALNP